MLPTCLKRSSKEKLSLTSEKNERERERERVGNSYLPPFNLEQFSKEAPSNLNAISPLQIPLCRSKNQS